MCEASSKLNALSEEFLLWCDVHKFPHMSADELLCELCAVLDGEKSSFVCDVPVTRDTIDWLRNFEKRWDEAQAQADAEPRERVQHARAFPRQRPQFRTATEMTRAIVGNRTDANNDAALARYVQHVTAIRKMAARIVEAADDHFARDPELVNWADVGSMDGARSMIGNVSEFLFGEGERE